MMILLILLGLSLIFWVANTTPIFPRKGNVSWGNVATANTALDGTGTVVTIFSADATNGSRIDYIKIKHLGTNIATVLRLFLNNGSTNSTATNNSLLAELSLAANTLSQTAQSLETIIISLDLIIPAGYKLNVTVGTTIAAGIEVTAAGGDY